MSMSTIKSSTACWSGAYRVQ